MRGGRPVSARTEPPISSGLQRADRGGYVILMGVGLESMTALHLAEEMAGRRLFQRWANGPDGEAMRVSVGGCSRGFGALDEVAFVIFGGKSLRQGL